MATPFGIASAARPPASAAPSVRHVSTISRAQNLWMPRNGIIFAPAVRPGVSQFPVPSSRPAASVASLAGAYQLSMDSQYDAEDTPVYPRRNKSEPILTATVDSSDQPLESSAAEDVVKTVPETTLPYKMDEEAFQAAIASEKGSAGSYWSHTMFVGPENQKITVHYCKSKQTSERIAQKFLGERVLGFDIEWVADSLRHHGPKKNVSLIQLASADRVALFHVAAFPKHAVPDLVAPTLKQIMEDPEVSKVGVAIRADCTRLRRFLEINSRSIFELSHLYKLVKYSASGEFKNINKRLVSLSAQVEEHMHLPLFKGKDVRESDWTQPLNMDQILYAASDTYASLVLFDVLEVKRQRLEPTPPRPYHADEEKPIRLAEGVITVDETEELEPEAESASASRGAILKSKELEEASMNVSMEADTEAETPKSKPTAKRKSLADRPKGPLFEAADQWAVSYKEENPSTRALRSQLRAYAIWVRNPLLSIDEIAGLLRDPPLLSTTVQNYILMALMYEDLPFDKKRMDAWPKDIVGQRRYGGIWNRDRRGGFFDSRGMFE